MAETTWHADPVGRCHRECESYIPPAGGYHGCKILERFPLEIRADEVGPGQPCPFALLSDVLRCGKEEVPRCEACFGGGPPMVRSDGHWICQRCGWEKYDEPKGPWAPVVGSAKDNERPTDEHRPLWLPGGFRDPPVVPMTRADHEPKVQPADPPADPNIQLIYHLDSLLIGHSCWDSDKWKQPTQARNGEWRRSWIRYVLDVPGCEKQESGLGCLARAIRGIPDHNHRLAKRFGEML
jgi:hypothetical protein